MSRWTARVWMTFDEFDEDLEVEVTFEGIGVRYPHEGMNDRTIWLTDIEDIECVQLWLDGTPFPQSVSDFCRSYGKDKVESLIARAEDIAEFEEDW